MRLRHDSDLYRYAERQRSPAKRSFGTRRQPLKGKESTADLHAARPVSSPFGPSSTLVRSTIALHPPVYAIICGKQKTRCQRSRRQIARERSCSRLGCGRQTIPDLLDLLPRR